MINKLFITSQKLDKIFDEGKEDIIEYLDFRKAYRPCLEMKTLNETNLKNLYEPDEHLWLEETIKLLHEKRFNDLDIDHLIEELESLVEHDKNRVSSFLEQIIRYLLLLQPEFDVRTNRKFLKKEIAS